MSFGSQCLNKVKQSSKPIFELPTKAELNDCVLSGPVNIIARRKS